MIVIREYVGKGYLICIGLGERLLRKRFLVVKEREREIGLSFGMSLKFILGVL